jgi:hypothetical protein
MICESCGAWIQPTVDKAASLLLCPQCGHGHAARFLPLFIVTGASGVGKTAVVAELRGIMPEWDIFETDILWDSGGDWHTAHCNWLRIAFSIAQSGRGTILCGTMVPEKIDTCDHHQLFSKVCYLNLHCDDDAREARLRARPAWRGVTDDFVREHARTARWLVDNADTVFDPPMPTVDTTHATPREVAGQIRDWALGQWKETNG